MWPHDTPLQGWWLLQPECLRAGARPWRGWVKNYRVGWGGVVTLEHPQIAPLWPRHPAIFSLFSSSASSLHIGISERKLVESFILTELRWGESLRCGSRYQMLKCAAAAVIKYPCHTFTADGYTFNQLKYTTTSPIFRIIQFEESQETEVRRGIWHPTHITTFVY